MSTQKKNSPDYAIFANRIRKMIIFEFRREDHIRFNNKSNPNEITLQHITAIQKNARSTSNNSIAELQERLIE